MALQKRLLAEIRDLQRRGRIAVRALGFRGAVRDVLYDRQEEFLYETAGSARRKPGYVRVSTTANSSRWYPPAIAARVRCIDAIWGWLRPFQILKELNLGCRLEEWAYIDRCVAALADVRYAAPAPDPKAVRAWLRRRKKEIKIQARAMVARDPRYKTAA
jgi:hypothetical protein